MAQQKPMFLTSNILLSSLVLSRWRFYLLIFVAQFATAAVVIYAPSALYPGILLSTFYGTQLLGAPLQGHVSDNYHRKFTLISAFLCIFVTLTVMGFLIDKEGLLSFVVFASLGGVLGIWGNGDVVARAALLDPTRPKSSQQDQSELTEKHYRVLLGVSFAVMGPSWIAISWAKIYFPPVVLFFSAGLLSLLPTLSSSRKCFSDLCSDCIRKVRSVYEDRDQAHRPLGNRCWGH